MPWKDQLKRLKADWDNTINKGGSSSQQPHQFQQPYSAPPPPPPASSRPAMPPADPSAMRILWQPRFEPGHPIAADWDAKIGNGDNGWGNSELQHYTADSANAFFTPHHTLTLRALAAPSLPSPPARFTSARLVSRQPLSTDAGCLVAALRLPCAPGIWPALWLLPQEPFAWPTDGEVDVAETWNGDATNRSCLHWGLHTEGDKHRVVETRVAGMEGRVVRFEWAWSQPGGRAGEGRLVWWVDGVAVMKAGVPGGTRALREWCVLLNVAMGGNVCQGRVPGAGCYDMEVSELFVADAPPGGGWGRFEAAWRDAPEGRPY